MIHWGIYSVPGYHYIYPKDKGKDTNGDAWAKLFKQAGAKYVVITSKHHDGFALWDAPNSYYWKRGKKYGPWNSVAIGPRRDIIGELAIAVRKQGLKFGIYYSLLE